MVILYYSPYFYSTPHSKLNTAHKIFKYLTKRFHDNEPIPCTNEFQRAGTATAAETPEKSPTSTNTATEQHVNAKLDEEDLSTTKDLSTRGMEDPRASRETSAEGNSAESADGTLVLLTGMPCETRNKPQNSLRATPRRLPIVGEQEAANSVATAGCTNGMVELAKSTETDADVNRTALLGGELAERACGVDEGDGTEHKDLRLPKAELYCEERHQRNRNA